ncbi:uroporphyrinogen decarboxylase family protein [Shigella flexneri]
MHADSQALHALLDKLAKSVTLYLNAQIKAGAQAVMIFYTGRRAYRARLSTVLALLHA